MRLTAAKWTAGGMVRGALVIACVGISALPAMAQDQPGAESAAVVSGWTSADGATGTTPALITVDDAGIRVAASAPVRIARTGRPLTGTYTVHAQFGPAEASVAEFGLIVGTERATSLLCGLRSDGATVLHRGAVAGALAWAPGGYVTNSGASGLTHLEVRVTATVATCFVNGQTFGSVPITRGVLDGGAGVYVGAGTSVAIRRFTVQGGGVRP